MLTGEWRGDMKLMNSPYGQCVFVFPVFVFVFVAVFVCAMPFAGLQ